MFYSCGGRPVGDKSQEFVEVEGTAEKEYAPDEFYLSININEADVANRKTTVEKLETEMKNTLSASGIDVKKDLTVMDMSSSYNYWYYWSRNRNRIVTSKQYQLKLTGMKQIETTFQKLEALGITNISISKVDFSGKDKLENEVRAQAVKNASEKAAALVSAVGQKIGKVIYIKEVTYNNVVMNESEAKYEIVADNAAPKSEEVSLDYNKQKAKSSIVARFEIR